MLVYPIGFLYRQYLELVIKDIIREARLLQGIDKPVPASHKLNELWMICHPLLNEISPGDSTEELKQVARLIGEFSTVDPLSTAFRYPTDNKGNPSLPGISKINLQVVGEVVDKISNILSGAATQVSRYLHDMESEYRNDSY